MSTPSVVPPMIVSGPVAAAKSRRAENLIRILTKREACSPAESASTDAGTDCMDMQDDDTLTSSVTKKPPKSLKKKQKVPIKERSLLHSQRTSTDPALVDNSITGLPIPQDKNKVASMANSLPLLPDTKKGTYSKRFPFPFKLYDLVNNATLYEYDHIVSWARNGRTFVVHDHQLFCQHILPVYYGHSTLRSFIRQLSYWGFGRESAPEIHHTSAGGLAWSHAHFAKGREDDVRLIRRQRTKDTFAGLNETSINVKTVPDGDHGTNKQHLIPHPTKTRNRRVAFNKSKQDKTSLDAGVKVSSNDDGLKDCHISIAAEGAVVEREPEKSFGDEQKDESEPPRVAPDMQRTTSIVINDGEHCDMLWSSPTNHHDDDVTNNDENIQKSCTPRMVTPSADNRCHPTPLYDGIYEPLLFVDGRDSRYPTGGNALRRVSGVEDAEGQIGRPVFPVLPELDIGHYHHDIDDQKIVFYGHEEVSNQFPSSRDGEEEKLWIIHNDDDWEEGSYISSLVSTPSGTFFNHDKTTGIECDTPDGTNWLHDSFTINIPTDDHCADENRSTPKTIDIFQGREFHVVEPVSLDFEGEDNEFPTWIPTITNFASSRTESSNVDMGNGGLEDRIGTIANDAFPSFDDQYSINQSFVEVKSHDIQQWDSHEIFPDHYSGYGYDKIITDIMVEASFDACGAIDDVPTTVGESDSY